MARIRTIKPEFWTDERIGEVSPRARLLFIATWNFADDHGGLERSAKQLKAQAFPYDDADCEPLIQELLNVGLLIEYQLEGNKYLHIKGFRRHQKVENPSKPRVPVYDTSLRTPRVLTEDSPSPHRALGPSSLEGKGRESKGREHIQNARAREAEDSPSPHRGLTEGSPSSSLSASVRVSDPLNGHWDEIKAAYPQFTGRQDWVSAEHYANAIVDRGEATPEELLEGVKRYAAFCAQGGTSEPGKYVILPPKFFSGADRPWQQAWRPPAPRRTAMEEILEANTATRNRVIEHEP